MNFRIRGEKINITSETKYIGLILDEHLCDSFSRAVPFIEHLQN